VKFYEAEDAVRTLLGLVGEDIGREGLLDTPKRVAKALLEMTSGYKLDPAAILATQFAERSDEFVLLKDIQFTSLCEHHMLPFVGTAAVGYLPSDKVVGLSKLARLVQCFAKRLQVQERMTTQIAESGMTHCAARGVGVVIHAHHACMSCRGVGQSGATMVTSSMLGMLRDNASARAEFLSLIR
jgi:GTP cyclohydrolase I